MGFFHNYTMSLAHSDGTVYATNLPVQLDTVNLPLNMEVQGLIPIDWYDLYSIGWNSPIPVRGDYFIDQATSTKYSMFSTVFVGTNTVQLRLTKYSGVTP